MIKKFALPLVAAAALFAFSGAAIAADECQKDADCKDGMICSTFAKPYSCKPPKASGETCKRDAACATKKCEKEAGQEVGTCL